MGLKKRRKQIRQGSIAQDSTLTLNFFASDNESKENECLCVRKENETVSCITMLVSNMLTRIIVEGIVYHFIVDHIWNG
jgi:hypothetical protein